MDWEKIEKYCGKLSEMQQQILFNLHPNILGKTTRETAQELGLVEADVISAADEIVKKFPDLRKYLGKQGRNRLRKSSKESKVYDIPVPCGSNLEKLAESLGLEFVELELIKAIHPIFGMCLTKKAAGRRLGIGESTVTRIWKDLMTCR